MEQGTNNNITINTTNPPLVTIQPPTNTTESTSSVLSSLTATLTSSIIHPPELPPIPYYVDTPPNQTALPSWYPPPHNYWSNPPHLLPRRMYHHGTDPNYHPQSVFSSTFGTGKPTRNRGRGKGRRIDHRLFSKNKDSNNVICIDNEQRMAIIDPPVFGKLEDLDDDSLLDISDQTLFERQLFHTSTLQAKLKYIEILKNAWDFIPTLKDAVYAKSNLRISQSSSKSNSIIIPPPPPSLPTQAPISQRLASSKKYHEEVEQRQLAYFETTAQYQAEQAQLDASINILRSQLEQTGLIAYLQGDELNKGLELGTVSQTRSRIEQLRKLREARLKKQWNPENSETEATSSNPVKITLTSPPSSPPLLKTSIENFPNEILVLIFDHFYAIRSYRKSDLLPAALVSRKWNKLITPIIYRDVSLGEDIEEDVDVIQRGKKEQVRRKAADQERKARLRQKAKGKEKATETGTLLTPDVKRGNAGSYFDLPVAVGSGGTPGIGLTPGVIGGQFSPGVEMVTPSGVEGDLTPDIDGEQMEVDLEDGVRVKQVKTLMMRPSYRQAPRTGGEPLVTMKYNIGLLTSLLNPQLAKHVRTIEYRARSFQSFPSNEFSRVYKPQDTYYGAELLDIRKRSVAKVRELAKKIMRNLTKVESLRIQGGDTIVANALLGALRWSGKHLRMLSLEGICLDRVCLDRGSRKKDGGKRYERLEEVHFEACWHHFRSSRRKKQQWIEFQAARKCMNGGRKLWKFLDNAPELQKLRFDGCEFPVEPILAAWAVPDETGCEVVLPAGVLPAGVSPAIDGAMGRRLHFKKLEALGLELQKKNRGHIPLQSAAVWDEALTSPLMEIFFKTHEGTLKKMAYHGSIATGLGPSGISSLALNQPKCLRVPPSIANSLDSLAIGFNNKARDGYNKPKTGYGYPHMLHQQVVPSKAFSLPRLLQLLDALKLLRTFSLNIGTGCSIDHVLKIASVFAGRSMRGFRVRQVVCEGRRPNDVITVEDVVKLVECLGQDLEFLEVVPARPFGNGGSADGQLIHIGLIEDDSDEGSSLFGTYGFQTEEVEEVPVPAPNPPLPPGVFLGQIAQNDATITQNQLNQMNIPIFEPAMFPFGSGGLGNMGSLTTRAGPKSGDIGFEFDHLLRILAPLRSLRSLILPYFYPPPLPISSLDLQTLEARLRLPHPINPALLRRRPPTIPNISHPYQPNFPFPPQQPLNFEEDSQPLSLLQFLDEYYEPAMASSTPAPPPQHPRKRESLASQREKYPIAAEVHAVKEAYLHSMRRIGRGFCATTNSFPELASSGGPAEAEPIWPHLEEVRLMVFATRTTSLIEIEKGGKGWSVEREVGGMGGMKSWVWEMEKERRRGGEGGKAVVGEIL